MCLLLFFFFFQAEDGIRDLVRSRGLGDVYKRQGVGGEGLAVVLARPFTVGAEPEVALAVLVHGPDPVSYTHLTLPTSDLV